MFKSISNNFGAPGITFRDFQTDRYAVLNARFQYDPANEAYLAASELEIKVPALSLSKSTDAGVFAVYRDERTYQWDDTPSRYHFATVLRSRIRDRSTLCIEKLTDFDGYGPVTIYIYAMYSTLNTGKSTVLSERTRLNISTVPEMSTALFTSACVVTPDWVSLNLMLLQRNRPKLNLTYQSRPGSQCGGGIFSFQIFQQKNIPTSKESLSLQDIMILSTVESKH